MAAIGEGWADGAWVQASWVTGAWKEVGAIVADFNARIFNIRLASRR
jgi:hypothetical protein